MTQPPARPPGDRQFARDVAKHIDRRRVRRRLTLWSALLALVSAAALWLRCGGGFGLLGIGGAGEGEGGEAVPRSAIRHARCAIRLTADGISVDGHPMSREAAVAACKATPGADVLVTGDARHADKEGLLAALRAAHINVMKRELPMPPGTPAAPRTTDGAPPPNTPAGGQH
jgi:hypothetical protein